MAMENKKELLENLKKLRDYIDTFEEITINSVPTVSVYNEVKNTLVTFDSLEDILFNGGFSKSLFEEVYQELNDINLLFDISNKIKVSDLLEVVDEIIIDLELPTKFEKEKPSMQSLIRGLIGKTVLSDTLDYGAPYPKTTYLAWSIFSARVILSGEGFIEMFSFNGFHSSEIHTLDKYFIEETGEYLNEYFKDYIKK